MTDRISDARLFPLALYGIYLGHGHSLSGELSERADLLKKTDNDAVFRYFLYFYR